MGWDEPVDDLTRTKWIAWLSQLKSLRLFKVPRWFGYVTNVTDEIQLHIFCDASEAAFAAVAYVRVKDSDGKITTNLLMSKSRVAPIKTLTLPRLELQGAILGIRLKNLIVKEMKLRFGVINFWTDSTINLQYINSYD